MLDSKNAHSTAIAHKCLHLHACCAFALILAPTRTACMCSTNFEPHLCAPADPGMTFCLPLAYYLESIEKKRRALTQEEVPLLSTEVGMTPFPVHALALAEDLILGCLMSNSLISEVCSAAVVQGDALLFSLLGRPRDWVPCPRGASFWQTVTMCLGYMLP
eukprot:702255-Pelagomonas_calceolata.AAC.8